MVYSTYRKQCFSEIWVIRSVEFPIDVASFRKSNIATKCDGETLSVASWKHNTFIMLRANYKKYVCAMRPFRESSFDYLCGTEHVVIVYPTALKRSIFGFDSWRKRLGKPSNVAYT